MKKILFNNFLSDKATYVRNRKFWINLIKSVTGQEINEYIDNSDFYDANPIVSHFDTKTKRGIRIIQADPNEADNIQFSAWLDTINFLDKDIQELVIYLDLTKETAYIAADLIYNWLINNVTINEMENIINETISLFGKTTDILEQAII